MYLVITRNVSLLQGNVLLVQENDVVITMKYFVITRKASGYDKKRLSYWDLDVFL